MPQRQTYFCEDISSIEVRGEMFFLTDKSGDAEITRAMRYGTFAKCVRAAHDLLVEFEAKRGRNVKKLPRH